MQYYQYILVFHIISMVSWMAVLFYLPRLFVYHQEHKTKQDFVDVVKIQEYKLYKYIGVPAMWATIISGVSMIYLNPALFDSGAWFYLKLLLAVLLIIYSFSLEYFRVKLQNNSCDKKGSFFRAYNEVPTILSILIITYAVLKSSPVWFSILITGFFIVIIYLILTKKESKSYEN